MLVTFKTESAGRVTLFGNIALSFLKMMGHSETVPGAIYAEDVPAALNSLNRAIHDLPTEKALENEEQENQRVSLRNRALPLINLLKNAVDTESYIRWEESI